MVKKSVTSTVNLMLNYRCSKCGTQNSVQDRISATVSVSPLSNDEVYFSQTEDSAYEIFRNLYCRVPYHRFVRANLSCRCPACKHAEPWARIGDTTMRLICVLCCAVPLLFFGILFFYDHLLWAIAPFLLSLGALIWLLARLLFHRRNMKKQIEALDPASIPRIFYHSYGKWQEIVPFTQAPEDCWICASCEEISHNKFRSCTYCGASKDWSDAQQANKTIS